MKRSIVLVPVVLLLVLAAACGEKGPKPEVVGKPAVRESLVELKYAIWVDCTIVNKGESGEFMVKGRLRGDQAFEEVQDVTLGKDEQTELTFQFDRAPMHDLGIKAYRGACTFPIE